ncbi:MAG: DUF6093 family protein [Jiangellaceae bacterium]
MSRAGVLARGQRKAEAGMDDRCLIRIRTGETVDQNTAEVVPTYDTIYEGKCRVQQTNIQAAEEDAGQAALLMVRLQLQLPVSATGIEPDMDVDITASRDPDLIGRPYVVRDLFHKTDATSRRIGIIERTS